MAPRYFFAVLLVVLLAPLSAQAQWQRVDSFIATNDLYAVNLVTADADYVYASVLAGQPVPNRFDIMRSADDGASWEIVFTGYNGAARGSFFDDLDGRLAVLIQGNGETGLLTSDDQGTTWTETPARLPTSQSANVARDGDTYLVTGGNVSYRSTDGGATWTPLEARAMAGVVRFGSAFYALNSIGQLFRLDGDAWTAVPFDATAQFATNLWVEGGSLWVKASAGSLFASADGAAWSAQSTAEPTAWGRVLYTPDDARPWFLYNAVFAQDLFLSSDQGATLASIGDGYPSDDNGALCTSNYAVTRNAVIGNAWACSFTEPERNGVFRYVFGETVATGPLDPGFGVNGRTVFPLFSGIEYGVAVLPPVAPGFGGDDATLVVGSFGSVVRLLPDGSLDPDFGTDGVASPRANGALNAFRVADGDVLVVGLSETWRVNADGSLDTGYGTDGVTDVGGSNAARMADDAVVVQGFFNPGGGTLMPGLVKLTPDGAVDTAFGTDGYVFPADRVTFGGVAVDSQNRIVMAFKDGSVDPSFVYRLQADGSPDAGFGSGGVTQLETLSAEKGVAVDAADRPVLAGVISDNGVLNTGLTRLTASGAVDLSFGEAGLAVIPRDANTFTISLLAIRIADGMGPVVGGTVGYSQPVNGGVLGAQAAYLARFTENGQLDEGFGDGGQFRDNLGGGADLVYDLAFDAEGRILAAGQSDAGSSQQNDRAFVLRAFPNVSTVDEEPAPTHPHDARLAVWPNPSAGTATVRLTLDAPGPGRVVIYDVLGREVARLASSVLGAGEHDFAVPSGLAPGVYVLHATVGEVRATRRFTVVR